MLFNAARALNHILKEFFVLVTKLQMLRDFSKKKKKSKRFDFLILIGHMLVYYRIDHGLVLVFTLNTFESLNRCYEIYYSYISKLLHYIMLYC